MSAYNAARRHEDEVAFEEGRHHPMAVVQAPDKFYDDGQQPAVEGATEGFASWLKNCTYSQSDRLLPSREIALRVCALMYLLHGGADSIDEMAYQAGLKRSTLWRRIRLVAGKTSLPIPMQKKTRSASTKRALKNRFHVRDGSTDDE